MPQTFTITAKGVDQTGHMLEGMGDRATRVAPAFEKIADDLLENEKSLWRRNGGGGAGKWPPNTKSTLASKVAKGLDHRVMRATGDLERSLTVEGARGQIRWWTTKEMRFGTSIFYAQFSQNAQNPARKRVVLKVLPKTKKSIRQTILEHIIGSDS